MSQSTICPKCECTYSQENPPKILINCSHLLCHQCLLKEILCPIDHKRIQRRKYTLEQFKTDQEILSLCVGPQPVQEQQRQPHTQDIVINICSNENKIEPEQSENTQNEQVNERIQTIQKSEDCNHSNIEQLPIEISKLKKERSEENIQYESCLLHSKSAELICMEDMCFICPSCALFGEHKHHKVQSFENFVLSFGNLAEQCLIIKQQMNEKEQNLEVQRLKLEIQQQIKKQKNVQVQNLKNHINHIIKTIRHEETKMIKNLEEMYKTKQTKLMSVVNSNQIYSKIKDYEKVVQTLSEGINHLLKMENIEKYIQFVDQNNSKSYSAKQGEYLLLEIDNNYKTLKKNITNQIKEIKVQILQPKSEILQDFLMIKNKNSQAKSEQVKINLKQAEKKIANPTQAPIIIKLERNESKTPILNKNNQEQMLINSVERSKQNNINNSLSPIAPVGSFQYVIESQFSAQIGGKTQRCNNFVDMSQIKLPSINLNTRNTIGNHTQKISLLNPTKRDKQSNSLTKTNNFSKNKSFNSSNQTQKQILSILNDKNEIKKKKKIDLPQKYIKIYDQLQKDNLDVLDLGGAFLGDNLIFKISEIIPTRTRLKTIKFMNNKITDDIFPQLLIRCTNINTLNLSYNNLTEKSLDFIQQEVDQLGHLANITLSNNKIVLRNVKDRLQMLKRKGVKISL